MNLVLLLSWYDEEPSWLAAVVAGFGRFCDTIVAVDGAYLLYPMARARSHPAQAEAILSAAEAGGVACTVHRPREPFEGNEVEKRNLTLALAAAHQPDWVIAADADYHVTMCDPEGIRGALASTDLNLASYELEDDGCRVLTRDIFRWTPDIAYGPSHQTVTGTYDGRRQWLRGPEAFGAVSAAAIPPCLDLHGALVCVHRNRDRSPERADSAVRYYRHRDELAIEDISSIRWEAAA